MSALSHRRAARSGSTAAASGTSRDEEAPEQASAGNAHAAKQVQGKESSTGPFDSPMLNMALEAAFGTSLAGLSASQDTEKNTALGARAVTEGSDMSFGQEATENVDDLDFVETAAHETAHALAGGGSGKTALDVKGDPGEAQADTAGRSFRAWAQTGFQGPAPSLKPATGGQADMHRNHTVGGWSGSPVLRMGSTGRQVRSLQTLLNAHGIRVNVDGSFGPRTRNAVVAFQRAQGIGVDGIAGSGTAGRLNAAAGRQSSGGTPAPGSAAQVTGRPALSFNSRGAIVSSLQALLNGKGASITVDGVFGAGTREALTGFQRANGLGVDGVVGPTTARYLNLATSKDVAPALSGGVGNYAGNEAFDSIRDAVIAAAESHLGAPYYWGGDGPRTFDCSGFILYVLRQNTGLVDWGDDTAAGISNRIPATNRPQKGDLVFFRGNNGITHVEFSMGLGSQTIGASGGGSRTFGQDPNAKVQYGDYSRDRRSKSFGSLDRLIQQMAGRQ